MAFESGASRPPGAMSRPPRRLRRSCTHDGADLLRDALGRFICEICGQPCEDVHRQERQEHWRGRAHLIAKDAASRHHLHRPPEVTTPHALYK